MKHKKTAGSAKNINPAHRKKLLLPIASLLLVCLTACTTSDPAANTTQPESPETSTAERTVTEVETGTVDGLDYELWKDTGTTEMTLNGGGAYRCQWSDINNALFRIGKKFDSTQNWDEVGEISVEYGADYFPVGNSYLCVYGWTREPLVEYYVVQSWGNWRPPGAESLGTITVDDATYDVYVTTRVEQPSIDGTQTFQQFWSVRKGKSTEGTVSVSEHFRAWQEFGMELGKLYEVALTVEGYQSSGTADVYKNEIRITPAENEP